MEFQVVLECARFRGARPDCLRPLLERVDPKTLAETATAHGVAPLCYQQICGLDPPVCPDVIAALKRVWLGNMYTTTQGARELSRLIESFDAAGIPVIPFKGLTLAQSAYGDICLRQVGDIDLLVRPSDVWDVGTLLASLGYTPEQTFSPLQKEHYLRNDCALYFRPAQPPPFLDLQWRFVPSYVPVRFEYSSWFDLPPAQAFQGRMIRAIPKDDLLLYLVLHGGLHTWCRVVHLADVVKHLESHDDWDWVALLRRAEAAGLLTVFTAGLRLCSELLGWPLPPEIEEESARNKAAQRVAPTNLQRLVRDGGKQPGSLRTLAFTMRILDRNRGLLNYAFKRALLPSASDWRFISIPDRLYFLYYPLRLVRFLWLVICFLKGAFGQVRKRKPAS